MSSGPTKGLKGPELQGSIPWVFAVIVASVVDLGASIGVLESLTVSHLLGAYLLTVDGRRVHWPQRSDESDRDEREAEEQLVDAGRFH
jgi:hypothetical protein